MAPKTILRNCANVNCNNIFTGRSKYCCKECGKTALNESWKANISRGRTKFLQENPDKHPWKNNKKFISKPCEDFKSRLRLHNIDFVEEFKPILNRQFSIDIAFPNKKFGIEINGNQHYNKDGSLKDYYLNRHKLIESHGWIIIEIHYKDVYSINLNDIMSLELYKTDDYKLLISERLNKNKPKLFRVSLKDKIIGSIKEHNIDTREIGWNIKVAKLLNIRTDSIKRVLKKYAPEFLNNCYVGYKRKCSLAPQ